MFRKKFKKIAKRVNYSNSLIDERLFLSLMLAVIFSFLIPIDVIAQATVTTQNIDTYKEIYYRTNIPSNLVLFNENETVPSNTSTQLASIINTYGITQIKKAFNTRGNVTVDNIFKIRFKNGNLLANLLTDIMQLSGSDYSEIAPNYLTDCTNEEPGYWNDNSTRSYYLKNIDMCNSMPLLINGLPRVRVAVVDNSAQIAHFDFTGNFANISPTVNLDVSNGDNDVTPPHNGAAPLNGGMFAHGTHCTGLIRTANNNSIGMASLGGGLANTNPIEIVNIKASLDAGDPYNGLMAIQDLYSGIDMAAQQNATIISVSAGSQSSSITATMSIAEATALHNTLMNFPNLLLVCAAGNANTNNLAFPAAASVLSSGAIITASEEARIIAVGALNPDNTKARFSNYGNWVDIFAPGVGIHSTFNNNDNLPDFETLSGTSMACPIVASAVGLLWYNNSTLTPTQIKARLLNGSINIENQNPSSLNGFLGSGALNVTNSLNNITTNQIRTNVSKTHFCRNVSSSVNLTFANLPIGVTISSVSWSVLGATASSFNTQNLTNLNFAIAGIYNFVVTASLSNSTFFTYRGSFMVYPDVVQLTASNPNPVCVNSSQQLKLFIENYSVADYIRYTYTYNLNTLNANTWDGKNKAIINMDVPNISNVFNLKQVSYYEIPYLNANSNFPNDNLILSCPIVNGVYTFNTVCCNNNSVVNGNFNAGNTGFTSNANFEPLANWTNSTNAYTIEPWPIFTSYINTASGGNSLNINGSYDNTNLPVGWVQGFTYTQPITFSPSATLNGTQNKQTSLNTAIWSQSNFNIKQGNSYIFSYNLDLNNPDPLAGVAYPLMLDLLISNGTNSITLPRRTFFNPLGGTQSSLHGPFLEVVSYDLKNIALPTGNYTISIRQVENFGFMYFDYRIDDVSLKMVKTHPCHYSDAWVPLHLNFVATPGDYHFVNTAITINTNITWTNTDIAFITNTSSITVAPGKTLTLDNCRLHGCDNMWEGIKVASGGKVVMKNNSMIEDAMKAINVLNSGSSTTNILDINTAIFNKNNEGIVIEGYGHVQGTYPFKIENSVFTCRKIGVTGCKPPNWFTVADMIASTTPTNDLATPFLMKNLPFVPLNNGTVRTANHINATGVGSTNGTLLAPTFSELLINNSDLTFNIFDNAEYAIKLYRANASIRNNVFQNCNFGVANPIIFSPLSPNGAGQLPNFRLKVTANGSSNQWQNRFFDCKFGIFSIANTWQSFLNNDFRSLQTKTNYGSTTWPPTNANTIGNYAILLISGSIANATINNNVIYNHHIGIANFASVGNSSGTNYFVGIIDIKNNIIWDKSATNTTTTPYCSEAIYSQLTNNATFTYNNAGFTTRSINIENNSIKNAFRGINTSGFTYRKMRCNILDNIITLAPDLSTSTVGTQHGIWASRCKNLYIKSNTVAGNNPTIYAATNYTAFANMASVKSRQTNFRMDNNSNQVITCNTSNGGVFGFEFNGPSSAPQTRWRVLNNMTGQHYIGFLLNNGAVIGTQGSGTLPINNTWNFTCPSGTQYTHTFTDNTAAINSKLHLNGGTTTLPSGNLTNISGNEYKTGLPTSLITNTATPITTCLPAPTINSPWWWGVTDADALVNGGLTFANSSTQLNYIAKQMTFEQLLDEPELQTISPNVTNFFNITNASTHPYRKMQDIQDDISNASYTNAQVKVNAFAVGNEIENNYKLYFNIAIKHLSGIMLSATDKTTLLAIANKCPHTQGGVVYMARSMYQTINFTDNLSFYPFYDDCSSAGGLYKKDNSVAKKPLFDVSLYPNPNSGQYYIQCNTPTDEFVTIKITDMQGKIIYTQNHKCNMGVVSLNTPVPTGIYVIAISNANAERVTKQLIIK